MSIKILVVCMHVQKISVFLKFVPFLFLIITLFMLLLNPRLILLFIFILTCINILLQISYLFFFGTTLHVTNFFSIFFFYIKSNNNSKKEITQNSFQIIIVPLVKISRSSKRIMTIPSSLIRKNIKPQSTHNEKLFIIIMELLLLLIKY